MRKSITNEEEVLHLGLELDFRAYEIEEFIHSSSGTYHYSMAAYKLVLQWRDVRSSACKEVKLKSFHDVFEEMNKHGVLCPDGSCQYLPHQQNGHL